MLATLLQLLLVALLAGEELVAPLKFDFAV